MKHSNEAMGCSDKNPTNMSAKLTQWKANEPITTWI